MRILTVIAGIGMMLTGIWCVAYPSSFFAIAFALGWVMILAGLIECGAHFFCPKKLIGFGWMLAEAFITFCLGCLVLFNQVTADSVVPLFFAMWAMYSGVTRLVLAISLKRMKDTAWALILALGGLSVIAGIFAFFNQADNVIATMPLLGAYFLLQGANFVGNGIIIPSKKRKRRS